MVSKQITCSRKEHILSHATVTLNRMHANRWVTYCARRTNVARIFQSSTFDSWEELLTIVNTALKNKTESITFEIPEHLVWQAEQYGYVARRLR